MFIDDSRLEAVDEQAQKRAKDLKTQTPVEEKENEPSRPAPPRHYEYWQVMLMIGGGFLFIILIGAAFLYFSYRPAQPTTVEPYQQEPQPVENNATGTAGLPQWNDLKGHGNGRMATNTEMLEAEDMTFGIFYDFPQENHIYAAADYELPLNIKADVANYYDVSRKLNLDPALGDLTEGGFAVLPDQLGQSDFFASYQELLRREIPVLVTADYLIYTFQNILKQAYKELEENAFYDSLWKLDQELYNIAQTRFKQVSIEKELSGDVYLEGARMEAAFLAVVLKLLEPTPEQVETGENFSDPNKFTTQEAENYSLELPQSLAEQVMAEVDLIRQARVAAKSPILLYQIDYSQFSVPADYRYNAKLNNFYQAKRWLNSVFPLYFQGPECQDCLLDYNDWMVSVAAATLLTQDLAADQDFENQWATVYKVISFFSGLRQDLTYLQMEDVLQTEFGQDFDPAAMFAPGPERDQRLERLQSALAAVEFNTIEGSQNRDSQAVRPRLGLRMLQEPYWPNDYIFDRLTGADMRYNRDYRQDKGVRLPTLCPDKEGGAFRCNGFGMDIVNLLSPDLVDNEYFALNSDYLNYRSKTDALRQELLLLDQQVWNSNMYWLSLDIVQRLFDADRSSLPLYAGSYEWQSQREVSAALAAWVNVHLPPDTWAGYVEDRVGGLGDYLECNTYSVVEPNLDLINDLMAKTDMLNQALTFLNLGAKTNAATVELQDYYNKLEAIKKIALKQLNGEERSEEDCRTIKDFTTARSVARQAEKSFMIDNNNNTLIESIEDLQMLLVVYQNPDGRNYLAVGPIFEYFESGRR